MYSLCSQIISGTRKIPFHYSRGQIFLSERILQDPLENFFGCQRQRGGASENPNVQDFCKNTQALRVINSVCGSVPRGNCRGNKQLMDKQLDHNPLPKCRRIQTSKDKLKSVQENKCYVSVCASPVISSQHQSTVSVEPVTVLVPSSVSIKPASDKITPSITENKHSTKEASNACGKTSVTKQGLSITETNCHQENNKCDTTPVAGNASKEAGQLTFVQNNSEATVKNDSLEERISEILRPGNEDEKVVSGYGITLRRRDFWTLKDLEWLNDQVKKLFIILSVCVTCLLYVGYQLLHESNSRECHRCSYLQYIFLS